MIGGILILDPNQKTAFFRNIPKASTNLKKLSIYANETKKNALKPTAYAYDKCNSGW